jgi:soluble lytic murein transglycosylase
LRLVKSPRNPNVDAVDWVERFPIAETRNHVQRVMENLQVYRARFGASIATVEPNLTIPPGVLAIVDEVIE